MNGEEHIYKEILVNLLAMFPKKIYILVEHCVYLILISLKNTKISWKISQKRKMHFVYIVTYLGTLLVIEWKINSLREVLRLQHFHNTFTINYK